MAHFSARWYPVITQLVGAQGGLTLRLGNGGKGETYGVEVWGDYQVFDWWRMSGGFSLLGKHFRLEPDSTDISNIESRGNDGDYKVSLRSSMNLTDDIEFDIHLRAVDALPDPHVPSYIGTDARLAWFVTDSLELSLAGFNLFDKRHPESGAIESRVEIPRTFYISALWRY